MKSLPPKLDKHLLGGPAILPYKLRLPPQSQEVWRRHLWRLDTCYPLVLYGQISGVQGVPDQALSFTVYDHTMCDNRSDELPSTSKHDTVGTDLSGQQHCAGTAKSDPRLLLGVASKVGWLFSRERRRTSAFCLRHSKYCSHEDGGYLRKVEGDRISQDGTDPFEISWIRLFVMSTTAAPCRQSKLVRSSGSHPVLLCYPTLVICFNCISSVDTSMP